MKRLQRSHILTHSNKFYTSVAAHTNLAKGDRESGQRYLPRARHTVSIVRTREDGEGHTRSTFSGFWTTISGMQHLARGDVWCECRLGGCQKDSEVLFEGGAADFFSFRLSSHEYDGLCKP